MKINLPTQNYELWLKMSQVSKAYHIRDYLASFRRCEGTISETHFEKQFKEELEIAKKYGNIIHCSIHKINSWKTVAIYKKLS